LATAKSKGEESRANVTLDVQDDAIMQNGIICLNLACLVEKYKCGIMQALEQAISLGRTL
jgi:hypothetical protein